MDYIGLKIKDVRVMTVKELFDEGWESLPPREVVVVIELEDGTKIYPSRDPEGNGPGVFFGRKGRKSFLLSVRP